jgi:hypothetical protein
VGQTIVFRRLSFSERDHKKDGPPDQGLFRFSWKWRKRSAIKLWSERMKKQRKHYTPEEKVAVLRRHSLDKEPISKLCDELGVQPTVF